MATTLSWSMTAQDAPGPVFTAYEDFELMLLHTAGASTVALQRDFLDNAVWLTVETFITSGVWIVEVPRVAKYRMIITTLDTGPVLAGVNGKLNLNDTIGGASPSSVLLDENGDELHDEAEDELLDEAA
jgi:hypothetical protein